jgi:hypothetical protein
MEVFPGDGVTVVTITDPELSTAVMAIDLAIRLGNRSNEAAAILARRAMETADILVGLADDPEPS